MRLGIGLGIGVTHATPASGGLPATTTALASSANPAPFGGLVTFTATVTSGGGTPAGNVSFYNGATLLGTTTLNGGGVATYQATYNQLPGGANAITAVYAGNGTYAASTSSVLTETITGGTFTGQLGIARSTPGNLMLGVL